MYELANQRKKTLIVRLCIYSDIFTSLTSSVDIDSPLAVEF